MTLSLDLLAWTATLLSGGALSAGVGLGAVLLAKRTGSREANLALGLLLFVASALVLYVLLLYVQPPGEHLRVVFAPLAFTFAVGPLLYAYVRARLGRGRPGAGHWVLPLAQAVQVVGVALAPTRLQQVYMGQVFAPWGATAQTVVFALSLGTYLVLSGRLLAGDVPAYEWAQARDRWLRRVLAGGALALVAIVVFNLVGPLFPDQPGQQFYGLSWVAFVEVLIYDVLLCVLAVGGYVQAEIGGERAEPERKEHYNLEPALTASHAEALARLVATERPHLDPNLSLGSLADQLGVTEKVLSYLLNETLGTTYTDYVNGLRVAEARARLADPAHAHLTVLGVGLDAGFASKSTFNRVFKEQTGETPSAYRQRLAAAARPDAS